MMHRRVATKLSNDVAVMSFAFGGVGCTRAAPVCASSVPAPSVSAAGEPAGASPAASSSSAGATSAPASSTTRSTDADAPPSVPAPRAVGTAGPRLYQSLSVPDPLGKDEVSFTSGPFRAPAVGEEVWVLGKAGPIGKARVVRWIPAPHDSRYCGGPSTVFILSVKPKPRESATVAYRPAGAWSAPSRARGYHRLPPAVSEFPANAADHGADLDGDGALDVVVSTDRQRGACQGAPTAQRLPTDPAYQARGAACTELWARDANGTFRAVERVTHGVPDLGY